MSKALQQARSARDRNEVPVGAVLVQAGKILSRGRNAMIAKNDPTAHAEIEALRKAGKKCGNYRLVDCEMYVSLEPCLMCYTAMVQARLKRLHFGATDPKTGVFSSGAFARVKGVFNHHIEVSSGCRREEAAALLTGFFQARRGAGAVERDGLENRCTG